MFHNKHNQQLSRMQTLRLFTLLSVKCTGFLFLKGLHLEGAAVRAEVTCRRSRQACERSTDRILSARVRPEPRCSGAAARCGMNPRLPLDGDIFKSAWERHTWVSGANCSLLTRFELMNKYSQHLTSQRTIPFSNHRL